MSLGRVFWTGPWPYPRYMASSLAPEWIEVWVGKELRTLTTHFSCYEYVLFWINEFRWRHQLLFRSPWSILCISRVNFLYLEISERQSGGNLQAHKSHSTDTKNGSRRLKKKLMPSLKIIDPEQDTLVARKTGRKNSQLLPHSNLDPFGG